MLNTDTQTDLDTFILEVLEDIHKNDQKALNWWKRIYLPNSKRHNNFLSKTFAR